MARNSGPGSDSSEWSPTGHGELRLIAVVRPAPPTPHPLWFPFDAMVRPSPLGADTQHARVSLAKGVLMGQHRRQFSPEFKADTVALVRSSGRSFSPGVRSPQNRSIGALTEGHNRLGPWRAGAQ